MSIAAQTARSLPGRWEELVALLVAPIVWILRLQSFLIELFVDPSPGWAAATYALLAFPALLGLAAVWCTLISLYTLPFRAGRASFLATLLVTWWEAAVAAWMYWVGMIRLALVVVWWMVTFANLAVRLAVEGAVRLALRPVPAADRMSADYFRAHVPWVAVALLVVWCALEAMVFTFTVLPQLAEALADRDGSHVLPRAVGPLVWVFLFLMALGSFVCIQVLVDAVKKRAVVLIVASVLVQLFVMSFEVVFLYRALAEALALGLVQQTGDTFRSDAWFTFSAARFGWTAVRGMAWFLFGQYATPPLLHLMSRQGLAGRKDPAAPAAPAPALRRARQEDFAGDLAWLQDRGSTVLGYLGLPVLHLVAAALNFAMVVVTARPMFSLPFRGITEATEPPTLLVGRWLRAARAAAASHRAATGITDAAVWRR